MYKKIFRENSLNQIPTPKICWQWRKDREFQTEISNSLKLDTSTCCTHCQLHILPIRKRRNRTAKVYPGLKTQLPSGLQALPQVNTSQTPNPLTFHGLYHGPQVYGVLSTVSSLKDYLIGTLNRGRERYCLRGGRSETQRTTVVA